MKAAKSAFKVLEYFSNEWRLHYEQYGKHWAGLLDQQEQALLILENADAVLKQAEHDEQTLRDEKRDATGEVKQRPTAENSGRKST